MVFVDPASAPFWFLFCGRPNVLLSACLAAIVVLVD